MGEGRHRLPDGLLRRDVIDEMCGRLHHPTRAAGWTKAASLARKGHQAPVTAGVALDAQKPVFGQAALQVVVELPLDEMRRGCAFGLQPGKKLRVAGLDDVRGRNTGFPVPPAQIRTCTLMHPAPALANDGKT